MIDKILMFLLFLIGLALLVFAVIFAQTHPGKDDGMVLLGIAGTALGGYSFITLLHLMGIEIE